MPVSRIYSVWRRWLVNSALLGGALLLACAIGESVARSMGMVSTVQYHIDKDVGQRLLPNQHARWAGADYDVTVVTNSAGFHDVEHTTQKTSEIYRVVVLGDSFMEALQVPIAQGFSQQLQALLQEWVGGKEIEVINLGISGTGPGQHYRMLQVVGLEYDPDLVILSVFPDNDFRDSHRQLSGAVTKPHYVLDQDGSLAYIPPRESEIGGLIGPWLRRSALLHMVRQAIVSTSPESWLAKIGLLAPASGVNPKSVDPEIPLDWYVYAEDAPDPWPEAYTVTLRMIVESHKLATERGAKFLVMTIGSVATVEGRWKEALDGYPGANALRWDFERPYTEIQAVAEREGFEVVNLVKPFKTRVRLTGRSLSWAHDGHWNAEGHRLAAEIVSNHLKRNRMNYEM